MRENPIFTQVQMSKPSSNIFDLTHDRKMSMRMGELVPFLCQETLPGDEWNCSASQLVRFAPMATPVMHRVYVTLHYFFVANRHVWPNWNNFISGGENGNDSSVAPYVEPAANSLPKAGLADYMGIPVDPAGPTRDLKFSALPFAAYNKIYNEYYRDQNLSTSPLTDTLIDGEQTDPGLLANISGDCAHRSWPKDRFTSALPFTQRGAEATIPLGTTAPIDFVADNNATVVLETDGTPVTGGDENLRLDVSDGIVEGATTGTEFALDVSGQHQANLSSATAAGIRDLRNAFKLQEWLEKNARGGARINEVILIHFGTRTSDRSLDRPYFIGGSKSTVRFSEVLQTSGTNGEPTPQGNMAGHGISVGSSNYAKFKAEEWGWIIGLMSIIPETAYMQGLPKQFTKWDKFDYGWPEFSQVGEQPIANEELYVTNVEADDREAFGYTSKYSEYKNIESSVHGEFRDTLDKWHLSRKFGSKPNLNLNFISCTPDDRIFAVAGEEQVYVHLVNNIKCRRKLPFFGDPMF